MKKSETRPIIVAALLVLGLVIIIIMAYKLQKHQGNTNYIQQKTLVDEMPTEMTDENSIDNLVEDDPVEVTSGVKVDTFTYKRTYIDSEERYELTESEFSADKLRLKIADFGDVADSITSIHCYDDSVERIQADDMEYSYDDGYFTITGKHVERTDRLILYYDNYNLCIALIFLDSDQFAILNYEMPEGWDDDLSRDDMTQYLEEAEKRAIAAEEGITDSIFERLCGEWYSEDGEYNFILKEDGIRRFCLTTPNDGGFYDNLAIAYIYSDKYVVFSGNPKGHYCMIYFEILEDGEALRYRDVYSEDGLVYYRSGNIQKK